MKQGCGLKPYDGVEPADDPSVYIATGPDPQMIWTPSREDRVALAQKGAVRVTVHIERLDGKLAEPCFFCDWGDGFSEDSRKPLNLRETGVYTAVAYSNAGELRRIRFDPSTTSCVFKIVQFSVEAAPDGARKVPRLSFLRRLARRGLRRTPAPIARALRMLYRQDASIGRWLPRFGGGVWRKAYTHQFEVARHLRSPHFAAPPLVPPRRDPDGARVVAFYLPQFHPIPENDAWWGRGFTEWTNVSKTTPQFVDHLAPRLPADLGFYDLRVPEVLRAQADLATRAGVDAFCFHYYWFAGQRLLERPLDTFVADESLSLPFMLCWANENWTRRWDGQESEILIAQAHSPEDDIAAFDDIARYMKSPRYMRSDGRPILVIYRPDALPDVGETLGRWRDRARALGLGELYLLCTNAFGFSDYEEAGFDGLLEFPPHALSTSEITHRVELLNPSYRGIVYDYDAVVAEKLEELSVQNDPRRLPGVMPSWDNEARKPGAGNVFHNARPEPFMRWTQAALQTIKRLAPLQERLLFVNAWNEWAEGAYLEPDRWFGHGFAHGLRSAIEAGAPCISDRRPLIAASLDRPKGADAVVLLHLYYPELIDTFAARLAPLGDLIDLIVTIPNFWSETELARLAQAMPRAQILTVPNVGRDIGGFVYALRRAATMGYTVFCKIHSKRSPHRPDGDLWRDALLGPLLDPAAVPAILRRFDEQPDLGLLAGEAARMTLDEPSVMHNSGWAVEHLSKQLGYKYGAATPFSAGSMFWGRTSAFEALYTAPQSVLAFEPELGRIDGTLAHGLERAMGAIVMSSGGVAEWSL